MAITVSVHIDTAQDDTWATDISSYAMSVRWQHGFAAPYQQIARDSTATVKVKNIGKEFSPESGAALSGVTKGRRLRIRLLDGATPYLMYVGWIQEIVPEPGIYLKRTAMIRCISFMQRAQAQESFVPIQESKTADQVYEAILENGAVYPPGLVNRWLLGVSGFSELGQTTILGQTSDYSSFETGVTTFNYIGDQWADGVSVLGALRDTTGREAGKIFLNRSGLIASYNGTHFVTDTVSDATFSDTMVALHYTYGARIINMVKCRYRPRKVGVAPEVLGRLDRSTKIGPGQTVEIAFRYADLTASGIKIAGRDALTPIANTDWTANSAENGTGTDYTASVTATIANQTATRTLVKFSNAAIVDVYLQAGAQIRGTAIRDFGELDITVSDDTSIGAYGLNPYTYPYVMDSFDSARAMAEYILASAKDPRGEPSSMTIKPMTNTTLQAHGLNRTIGDRITIAETQTGLSKDFFIISEMHIIEDHINSWTATYGLEPASMSAYWLLGTTGYSELGQTTILGPL